MEQSLKYIVDYINPKVTQVQELTEENINLKIDIDSVEHDHPIFPNRTVLKYWDHYYFIHSGKRRRIGSDGKDTELLEKIQIMLRKGGKPTKNWTITINEGIKNGIELGPDILKEEDISIPLYTVNTGKELPPSYL